MKNLNQLAQSIRQIKDSVQAAQSAIVDAYRLLSELSFSVAEPGPPVMIDSAALIRELKKHAKSLDCSVYEMLRNQGISGAFYDTNKTKKGMRTKWAYHFARLYGPKILLCEDARKEFQVEHDVLED